MAHANHICLFSTSFIVFIETLYHHKFWVLSKLFLWSTILSHLLLEELSIHTHRLPVCDSANREKERYDSCLHVPSLVLGLVRWRAIDYGFWWGTNRPFNFCHTIMVSSFMISLIKHNKHSKISWRMKNVRVGNFSSVKLTTHITPRWGCFQSSWLECQGPLKEPCCFLFYCQIRSLVVLISGNVQVRAMPPRGMEATLRLTGLVLTGIWLFLFGFLWNLEACNSSRIRAFHRFRFLTAIPLS